MANLEWLFLVGPCPVLLLFCCFSVRRNASLAGGFAGRCGLFWLFVLGELICHFWTIRVLFTQIFTAYAIVRTEPSAFSATPEENKIKK